MKKIEKNLVDSQKVYQDIQRAMVNLETAKYLVNFSDDIHDKLSSIRLIFDYFFTKYGNYEFRRDCIVDFKVKELENILEALDSFVLSYQDLLRTYREKPTSKNLQQIQSA
jgi:hypothetical protein